MRVHEPADGHNDYLGGYSRAVYEKIRNNDRRAYEQMGVTHSLCDGMLHGMITLVSSQARG